VTVRSEEAGGGVSVVVGFIAGLLYSI
jgi:hypothetical protein